MADLGVYDDHLNNSKCGTCKAKIYMRKTRTVTISAEGRDRGKQFVVTEMAAEPAEKWGMRLLGALTRSGVEVPDSAAGMGMAALLSIGLAAALRAPFADLEPLLDEMMACVQVVPDPARPFPRPLVADDVEEVATRLLLRSEVVEVHTGFSVAAYLSSLQVAAPQTDTPPARTSRRRSRRSSSAA